MEICPHSVVAFGLCALCGQDVSSTSSTSTSTDHGNRRIQMLPGKTMLTVSSEEASRIEHQVAARLKRLKKLSLVVDLDQTLLHATMDPVVAEWLSNLNHPFHEASLGIQTLLLADSLSVPYYVKFRNRLHEFLENITPYFDLHIYTMGTWAYADAIAKCIDPLGKYFHDDRIMTRDRYWKDSGDRYGPDTSLLQNWTKKHLKSLFPCQDDMVLILDDRVDVWESSPNLIRIKPYEFFKGFGDINDPSKVATAKSPQGVALPPGQTSATAIYPNSLQAEAQDTQLEIIKNLLLAIHSQYYHNLFTRRLPSETDTKYFLALRKREIFKDCRVCFSGVFPLGSDPTKFDAWKSVLEYGGDCMTEVRPGVTTHLISVTPSTDKCQQIRRFNSSCSFSKKAGFTTHSRSSFVWIIRLTWLYDSMYAWERAPELQYTFPEDFSFFQDCSVANSQYNSTSPADDGSPSPELSYANTLMIASNPSLMTQEDEDLALLEDLSQDESEHGNFIAHKRKYSSESTESGPNTTESESDDASFIEELESEMLDTE